MVKRKQTSDDKVMVVLNSIDMKQMFADGGCGFWVASPTNVLECRYLVSTYNSRRKTIEGMEHGSAYMIGEISGVTSVKDRTLVNFSHYAEIHELDVWTPGGSNPVHYEPLAGLSIDFAKIEWREWPGSQQAQEKHGLTIQEAKLGLAKTFGVMPEQVEISIKA